jgi:hypothetical protein
MLTAEQRRANLKTVFRVASGNFLEMYDFVIFGYFSAAIGRNRAMPGAWLSLAAGIALVAIWMSRPVKNAAPKPQGVAV